MKLRCCFAALMRRKIRFSSGETLTTLESVEVRTYISEKKQPGRRHWEGKAEQQQATYANRRRI